MQLPVRIAGLVGRAAASLRRKRWDYWALQTPSHLLAVLVADVGSLGVAAISLLELDGGRRFEAGAVTPFGADVTLPEAAHGGPIRFERMGVRVAIEGTAERLAIAARGRTLRRELIDAEVVVEQPQGFEPLDVTVPFRAARRSHFTSKRVGLPARGHVRCAGRAISFDGASACLDFGRGDWPYRTEWCWAAAAGVSRGRRVALNLGGLWTDASGVTENGFWIDGRLHRMSRPVAFVRGPGAWRVESKDVGLTVEPVQHRLLRLPLGVISARLDWRMARLTGALTADDGARLDADGLLGWAEHFDARW